MNASPLNSRLPIVAGPPLAAPDSKSEHRNSKVRSRLWLWFVAAFVLQVAAWTAWFAIAARHPVAEVPLATAER